MTTKPIDQFRERLAAIGPVPVGSFERRPKDHQSTWTFMTSGLAGPETIAARVFELFGELGIEQEYWRPGRRRLRGADSDSFSGGFLAPVESLRGDRSSLQLYFYMGVQPLPDGRKGASVSLQIVNHWFAPLSPGLFHDNRRWAKSNRPLMDGLFGGLAELGLTHVPNGEEFQLSPIDASGFTAVDFDRLRAEVSKRWRSVVEGRQAVPTDRAAQLELQPKIPPGDPVWLSLLGFDHSDEEVYSLFDGVQRGEEAARRALNWVSAVKAPQHLGQRDELLELGRELQRQLVVAVSDLDTELAMQIRSLPIFLQGEALAHDGGSASWSLADLRDLLFANAKPEGEYIWPMYQLEIGEVAAASSPLVFAHLAAPVAGLNCNLSAACELWRLGGKVKLSDEALQIDLNTDLWVQPGDIKPLDRGSSECE